MENWVVLLSTARIAPPGVNKDLSISRTMEITLKPAKLSGAGPPPGALCSCVTSAVAVASSSAGQPAASKVRPLAAPATIRQVSRKPARLKKKGSCRRPVKTRSFPSALAIPSVPLASPLT